jgi:dTDP-4-amino-4,6-dideoxygalactose transaminase
MPVPLLDVNAQNHPLAPKLREAFERVLASGQFIMGPDVLAFEQECAAMLDAKHAISCSSGTDALVMALMALGLGPGDEVILPTFTFFATAGSVARIGATPVFVDVCPICFNIDAEKAAAKITPRTKAIMPVHLFGQSADMDAIETLAQKHQLWIIEDCAQAIGARYKGKACGTIGHYGAYSFFPSKNLGGFGDGGLLVTNDDTLAEKARMMRNHGMQPKYFHSVVGGNFRMDTLQAALLRVKLEEYDQYTVGRQRNAAYYTEKLSVLPGVVVSDPAHCQCAERQREWLAENEAILVLPIPYAHNDHIWNQYTIRVIGEGRRDALKQHLQDRGIGCEVYYPLTMDQQACFAHLPETSRNNCEIAHTLASEVISIPIFAELTQQQRDEVIDAIATWSTEIRLPQK